MDLHRLSTWFCIVSTLVAVAGLAQYRKMHRVYEFRGSLRHGFACIPEDPCGDALLLTVGGRYELSLAGCPEWRGQLPDLDGKEVVVRGTLRVWPRGSRFRRDRQRYWRDWLRLWLGQPVAVHRRIRVHELRVIDSTTIAPSTKNGKPGLPKASDSLTYAFPIPTLSCAHLSGRTF